MRGRQARRIDLGVHRYLSRVHELIGLWLPGRRWPDRQRPLYGLPRLPANQLSPAMTNDSMNHRSLILVTRNWSGGVDEVGGALFEVRHHGLNLIRATNQ